MQADKLTPEVEAEIIATLAWDDMATAADQAGIPRATLLEWLERGERGERRYKAFYDRCVRTLAEVRMEALGRIQSAADIRTVITTTYTTRIDRGRRGEIRQIVETHHVHEKDQRAKRSRSSWRAAAWVLERRYPEEWGRPSRRRQRREDAQDAAELEINPELDKFIRRIYGDPEPETK